MNNLQKYNAKRDFNKTKEPKGIIKKSNKKLKFCIQHHFSRKEHYDFRLELNGVLLSWAIPKGPSYNPQDKRLAVHTENHPISYINFEGTIPQNEYGGGVVMLWDEGYWEPQENPNTTYKKGYLKFILYGKRLKGKWTLIHFKDNNWLLIKEKDNAKGFKNINYYKRSIKTNRTIKEIENNVKNKDILKNIEISNPNKIMYKKDKITKLDIINYYNKVSKRMLPLIKNRIISTIRCPQGIDNNIFFKKHFETDNKGIGKINIPSKGNKTDYYYFKNAEGLLSEIEKNSIEIHIWGSKVKKLNKPDIMVFDLDPDEKLSLEKVREGVKDLKKILDDLKLKAYLKTSGGKGYHIVVPIKQDITWQELRNIAKNIAQIMESKWPEKYTSNMRKNKRKNKIYIDWVRNTLGSTSIAPYSLRARENAPVSMPIKWSELEKIKPNEITIKDALKRLKRKDPWEDFNK